MKVTLTVGVILIVFGGIWFLQGTNVLPGSFRTGQIRDERPPEESQARWQVPAMVGVAILGRILENGDSAGSHIS